MRAVRAANGAVSLHEVDAPSGEGVRVRVASVGICGSDLHLIADQLTSPRTTLGHEIAGTTANGTPVAIEPLVPCDECEPCVSGAYNLCTRGGAALIGIGLDGGMADEVLVPERTLVPLPAGLDVRDASLVEPLAVVVHALRRSGAGPLDRVAVIGGGNIGLCAVAVARSIGCEVGLVARHEAQREAGERLGAVPVSGLYDVVIEAAGSESALATAVELAKPGAHLSVPGIYWGPVALPGLPLCLKQVDLCPATLYGRHAGGRDVDAAAALLAANPAIADTLITHRFPLDAVEDAFATASSRADGAIKVVLEP